MTPEPAHYQSLIDQGTHAFNEDGELIRTLPLHQPCELDPPCTDNLPCPTPEKKLVTQLFIAGLIHKLDQFVNRGEK